jgi:Putative DNA-binding domain
VSTPTDFYPAIGGFIMPTKWDQAELQRHIDDEVEENLNLEYKAGDALGASDGKKREITKDVSAMANSAGGIIIYGMKEYDEEDKKHLPEKFTPIDRTQLSKEWLEQVINTIQPRINGIVIHSVSISTGADDVAYVVEIPQSTTAHQARDKRYYKRFNFLSEAMEDYEIRDVMHRATLPDVNVEFSKDDTNTTVFNQEYSLNITIWNDWDQGVERFMLHFTFPNFRGKVTLRERFDPGHLYYDLYNVEKSSDENEYKITFRSKDFLFPREGFNLSEIVNLKYKVDTTLHHELMTKKNADNEVTVTWRLFADNMPPKQGKIPFSTLYDSDR